MNNRNVFQAFTPARSDIDTNKCLALITAAYNGHTEEAVRLASDPQVDINFLAYFPRDENQYAENEYHSALSASLIKNHGQIVLFLLQQGANVDAPASGHYYKYKCFRSALSIACVARFPSDLNLFKPLLRATKMLHHDFDGWDGSGSLIKFLMTNRTTSPDKEQRIILFFHEAVLKNEDNIINEFLTFRNRLNLILHPARNISVTLI